MANKQEFDNWVTWPDWAKDALVVDVDVHFSFLESLRVLWHRRLTVTSKTWTRVVIGEHTAVSWVHVPPFRTPRPLGMVTGTPEPPQPEKG